MMGFFMEPLPYYKNVVWKKNYRTSVEKNMAHSVKYDVFHQILINFSKYKSKLFQISKNFNIIINFKSLRGVVVDLSGLRDRGPKFKTRSRPLTFMKADTNFRTLHVVGFSLH